MKKLTPSVQVKELHFSNGKKIIVEPDECIIFVGANNCGKTTALKNIFDGIFAKKVINGIITEVICNKVGEKKDVEGFLSKNYKLHSSGYYTVSDKRTLYPDQISRCWDNSEGLGSLIDVFFRFVRTENRLTISKPVSSINVCKDSPTHPLDNLYCDDELEKKISTYFRQAFETDLILHVKAGSKLPLYCGKRPELAEGEDRCSTTYAEKIENRLSPLEDQGDGIKSFVGVILHTILEDVSAFINFYQKCGVKVKIILDFDILRDTKGFKNLCKSMGAQWRDLENDYHSITSYINGLNITELTIKEVYEQIGAALIPKYENKSFSKSDFNEITKILKRAMPKWNVAKTQGIKCLGDAQKKSWNSLDSELQKLGIYIVPVGELESFHPFQSLHGSKWLDKISESFETDIAPELARKFMINVLNN